MTSPRFFRPRPPLVRHIEYFGLWDGSAETARVRGGAPVVHTSRALPRGAATAIIDLGRRDESGRPACLYASDGRTALSAPPAFLVGPGTDSYVTRLDPTRTVLTVHFRPAGALPFIGYPLGELENTVVGLTDLWGPSAARLLEQLAGARSAERRVALLETFLLQRMCGQGARLTPEMASILVAAERNPSMTVAAARDSIGVAAKRFNAMFRSKVGLSPKAYFRVRRVQAALRALDAATPGARIAADLGYFDQAHFVREFEAFAAITPTQYVQRRSAMRGHLDIEDGGGVDESPTTSAKSGP